MAGLGQGSRPHNLFPPPSPEVTHVVMEGTSAEEAVCWQERKMSVLPPGCTRPHKGNCHRPLGAAKLEHCLAWPSTVKVR